MIRKDRKLGNRFFLILAGWLIIFALSPAARAEIVDITVGTLGPACRVCNNMIKAKLKRAPGIEKVIHNIKDSTFTLIPKEGQPLDLEGMKRAVKESGYTFDFIELTLKGTVGEMGGMPIFTEPTTGQVFRLVQGETEPLLPERLLEIENLSFKGKNILQIKGRAYPGEPMNALEPQQITRGEE